MYNSVHPYSVQRATCNVQGDFITIVLVAAASNLTNESFRPHLCRTVLNRQGRFCTVEDFARLTCLLCYLFLPEQVIPVDRKFMVCKGTEYRQNCTHISLCAPHLLKNGTTTYTKLAPEAYDLSDSESDIYRTFLKQSDTQQLHLCCRNAVECCSFMLSEPSISTDAVVCPRTWDGWQCFNDTRTNQSSEVSCPEHIYFGGERPVCPIKFKRSCEHPGHWPYFPKTQFEWTDYSSCVAKDTDTTRHYTHLAAYGVSLLALAPALTVSLRFTLCRQLRVPRITMHKNLFISIFINGIVFIIFKYLLILQPLVSSDRWLTEGTVGCKFLYVLTKYSRTSNYMWMFCEGLYLHKLIVAAFAEQKNLIIYYLIGWGFPIIPASVYSILMLFYGDSAKSGCWYAPSEGYEWVFHVPSLLSLALNVIFLCNIIRVLIIKLRATNTNEPSQYKKAVRATFVLVPLFGVHFVITIHKPSTGPCTWLEAYYYVNYLLDGLQ
uniref:G-protein coupled receptors family 2 profile 2 domain-containing protein n=1 Tax=Strigamia maritima TaxID=126957 RepID=T1JCW9_STRMM